MQALLRGFIHLIAAFAIFTLVGIALASLTVQSKFLDMRFDVEVFITIGMIVGVLLFFMRLFMNAKPFGVWEKQKVALSILIGSLLVILIFNFSSLTTLPAYMLKKAIYMQGMSNLIANIILASILVLAFVCSHFASKYPVVLKKETNMHRFILAKHVWACEKYMKEQIILFKKIMYSFFLSFLLKICIKCSIINILERKKKGSKNEIKMHRFKK